MSVVINCKGCGRKMEIPVEILTPKDRNQNVFGRKIECADCKESFYYKLSDGDQGNDSLGIAKIRVTWRAVINNDDRETLCTFNELKSFINGLIELGRIDIYINDTPHEDYFNQVKGEPIGKPDPAVVGGKDLPFKHEVCEPVTVEVTWMEGAEERSDETSITNIVSFVDQLIGLGMTSIFIQDFPHDDFFSMITDKDSICAIEDQHGEPYCHTHKCGPTDPCIVKGCPHCLGDQKLIDELGGKYPSVIDITKTF